MVGTFATVKDETPSSRPVVALELLYRHTRYSVDEPLNTVMAVGTVNAALVFASFRPVAKVFAVGLLGYIAEQVPVAATMTTAGVVTPVRTVPDEVMVRLTGLGTVLTGPMVLLSVAGGSVTL